VTRADSVACSAHPAAWISSLTRNYPGGADQASERGAKIEGQFFRTAGAQFQILMGLSS